MMTTKRGEAVSTYPGKRSVAVSVAESMITRYERIHVNIPEICINLYIYQNAAIATISSY